MSPESAWCTLEKATEKYCLETALILKWAEDGVVRSEQPDTRLMTIKAEDLERKLLYEKNVNHAFRDCD